jgi:transcriptional regulator of acetoin/glycerol metabolism
VLEETEGNISQAAEILGVQRMTLYNKLKKYNKNV